MGRKSVILLIAGLMSLGLHCAYAQSTAPELRAECRAISQTRYDPGDVGRPLAWRDRASETYILRLQPNEEGRFVGQATFIPSVGEPQSYAAGFNWADATLWLVDEISAEPHMMMRLVNTGAGPVYDALTLKPARSGPQLIRYSCSLTCQDRPLKNLLPQSCPVPGR